MVKGNLKAGHLISHIVLQEKWSEMWLSTDSWAAANGMAEMSGILKEYDWKIGDRNI